MIVSRTPYRVSFFGGGTDYPTWYRYFGGAVLGTAINRYCYIHLRALPPFFEHKHRFSYSRIELITELAEIQHPAIRAVLQESGIDTGLEILHSGDLPARSGLGSSSTFTVGLLNALAAFEGRMRSETELAKEAIRVEQEVIKENVGSQDQVWAAFGGFNVIRFRSDDTFDVTPVILPRWRREAFESYLLLFYTGQARYAHEVAGKQIANLLDRRKQLMTMREMVDEALAVLRDESRPLTEFGTLLHDSWRLKRELADEVSTSLVDEVYEAAREAGAVGGKLLGAGGGGFMMFLAPPEKHPAIRERLKGLVEVHFRVGAPGSKIAFYDPDGLEKG